MCIWYTAPKNNTVTRCVARFISLLIILHDIHYMWFCFQEMQINIFNIVMNIVSTMSIYMCIHIEIICTVWRIKSLFIYLFDSLVLTPYRNTLHICVALYPEFTTQDEIRNRKTLYSNVNFVGIRRHPQSDVSTTPMLSICSPFY